MFPARAAWRVLLGLILAVGAALLGSTVVAVAVGQLVVAVLVAQALLWGGLVATAANVSRRYGSGSLRHDYQFHFRRRDLLTGLGVSILMRIAAGVGAVIVVVALGDGVTAPDQLESFEEDRAALLAFSALAVVGAPLVEELFFRGLVMRVLQPVLGIGGAVVAQAVLFGLAHAGATAALDETLVLVSALSCAGVVLGATAQRARRLGPAVVGHAYFNLVSLALVALMG